ncbi:uncharacterized protein A4U43_C03F9620 [Asparagus officinalis]|uniref:Uncharacterized protein n=1 Tax=Asparagus officinalis TaxID=4686 RepID=A0A5P1F8S7_ASPOF|nr:uncharacterized protein A4U43_C03F9620 [Asparagus officinalis]
MGSAIRQETSEFIALDIENLDKDSIPNSSPRVIKNYSRKGSMKLGAENQKAAAEGEFTALAMNGGAHSLEKHAVCVQAARAEEPVSVSHVTTPTSAGERKLQGDSPQRRRSVSAVPSIPSGGNHNMVRLPAVRLLAHNKCLWKLENV